MIVKFTQIYFLKTPHNMFEAKVNFVMRSAILVGTAIFGFSTPSHADLITWFSGSVELALRRRFVSLVVTAQAGAVLSREGHSAYSFDLEL